MGSVDISKISEVYGGPVELPNSIFEVYEQVLQKYGDRPAVIATHQEASYLADLTGNETRPKESCLTWTFNELHHAAIQLVGNLANQYGLGPGASITTFIPNGVTWPIAVWASVVGKYLSTWQDPGMLTAPRAPELQNVLGRTAQDILIVADAEGAAAVDQALSAIGIQPRVKIVAHRDRNLPAGWLTLSSFAAPRVPDMRRAEIERSARDDDPDRICMIMFTSGTTSGVPKGCPRTMASFILAFDGQYMGSDLSHESRFGVLTQNFRAIASLVAFVVWAHGASIVMPGPGFSPGAVLEGIEKQRITTMVVVPAMVHAIAAHPNHKTTDLSSLQSLLMGGDMVTRNLYVKACNTFPNTEVLNGHGMTEGGVVYSWPLRGLKGDREAEISWYADIANLGKVQRGSYLRIVDDENNIVKRGEIGEIHYSNISFIRNYLDNVKPEDFYTDQYGPWFKTGDTGMMNDEGLVWILGRKKDIVKRAAVSINPAALESCLDTFLKSQTSVIGIPHAELGQEPFAVVRDLGSRSKKEVETEIINVFGEDSSLGGVATLKDLGLNDFPRNATDKIMKRDLEKLVVAYLEEEPR